MSLSLRNTPEHAPATEQMPEREVQTSATHEQLAQLFAITNPTVPSRLKARADLFEAMTTNQAKYPVGANRGLDKVQTA
jgi:hypothetical protein